MHFTSPGVQFNRSSEGVYSCVIPDENGDEKILHFGLYDYGFAAGERKFLETYYPLAVSQYYSRSFEYPGSCS